LETVQGYVLLYGDPSLEDLSALGSLKTVQGYFEIHDCDALTSLTGLEALTTLGEDLDLRDNSMLSDITALSALSAVGAGGGGFALSIALNPSLQTLEGLGGLTEIEGHAQIVMNGALNDVSALESATVISGDLTITGNTLLCQSDALAIADKVEVSGTVNISGNGDCAPVLEDCEPGGFGEALSGVEFTPSQPDECASVSVAVSGTHPGLNYDFGTTNVGVCHPPFNCGPNEAVITLNLTATPNTGNPAGPSYESLFELGTLAAPHTYCVRVNYNSSAGVSETVQTSLQVKSCPDGTSCVAGACAP
jgi:hypothetical protein